MTAQERSELAAFLDLIRPALAVMADMPRLMTTIEERHTRDRHAMEDRLSARLERIESERAEFIDELRRLSTAMATLSDQLRSADRVLSAEIEEERRKPKSKVQIIVEKGAVVAAISTVTAIVLGVATEWIRMRMLP